MRSRVFLEPLDHDECRLRREERSARVGAREQRLATFPRVELGAACDDVVASIKGPVGGIECPIVLQVVPALPRWLWSYRRREEDVPLDVEWRPRLRPLCIGERELCIAIADRFS